MRRLSLIVPLLFLLSLARPAFGQTAGAACNTADKAIYPTYTSGGNTAYVCNGSTLSTLETVTGNPVRKGINTTSPQATFDVNGEVRIGNTGLGCSGTTGGAQRYNSTSHNMEFCNGTAWMPLPATCSGTTPAAFAFTDLASQTISTLVTSNILQLTGMSCAVTTGISGAGSPAYRTCSDSACSTVVQDWTTGTSLITSGQYLQLRQTTSASGGVATTATLTAGNGATVWSAATTGSCASSPPVGTICADGSVYAGVTPDGSVPMYVQRCDAGQSWNGSACAGSGFFLSWNNGANPTIDTFTTNTTTGKANTATLVGLSNAESPYEAAAYCHGLSEDGHTDWYLPSMNELAVVMAGSAAIGNFEFLYQAYWTSTEAFASDVDFEYVDGYQYYNQDNSNYPVRCVRR